MGLDQSLYTPSGNEEAYFRNEYCLHTYFCVHRYEWIDPNDKWAPEEQRIDVKDIERLVKICKILLKAVGKTNFIQISKRLLCCEYHDDEDFGEGFIYSLNLCIQQVEPMLKLNPKYFLYSAG